MNGEAVHSVYAFDLDGDNDLDVLSGSFDDFKIAWYENLNPTTSTSEVEGMSSFKAIVYPNPAIDIINIDVSDNLKYEATIYDLQGRKMISTTNQSAIDIQTLAQGTCLIEIKDLDSGQKVREKIIKGK